MEKIIVSLTTWEARINNIPTVLDTILNQTMPPDLIVLNVNNRDIISPEVSSFLTAHNIEINEVDFPKVYKKLVPTLIKYPDDCIISIDDDWLYPQTMIADFIQTHHRYPNHPISGNKTICHGMVCHCGCASLTKSEYFPDLSVVDQDLIDNCPSDDIVYTFLASLNGHPYVWTGQEYYTNMVSYHPNEPYSTEDNTTDIIDISYKYLLSRFGNPSLALDHYINDPLISGIINQIVEREKSLAFINGANSMANSKSYKLGNSILKPFWKISHNK